MRYTLKDLQQRSALALVADERTRQALPESQGGGGHDADHDDTHDGGELADAAAAYATTREYLRHEAWPFNSPCPLMANYGDDDGRVSDLVRAGALILAELDRLNRAARAGGA